MRGWAPRERGGLEPRRGGHYPRKFERELVAARRPGDVVVMDNRSSHKVAGVREVIEAVEVCVLYLPPYSPDYNPIKPAFSKLKQGLRSTGHGLADELWADMQRLLDTITPSDAQGFFRHFGYTLGTK